MKDIICDNKEEFIKITDILLKKGYDISSDYYAENPIFSNDSFILIYDLNIENENIIDWIYISNISKYSYNIIYAKEFINEIRKKKLNKINV